MHICLGVRGSTFSGTNKIKFIVHLTMLIPTSLVAYNHVNLLFIVDDEGNNHYVLIKNKVN